MRVEGTERTGEGQGAQPAADPQTAAAQRLLNRLFRGAGLSEDGRMTPETREAIRDFQRSHDLPPSGDLDPATVGRMQRVAAWIAHEEAAASAVDDAGAQAGADRQGGASGAQHGRAAGQPDPSGALAGELVARRLQAQVAAQAAPPRSDGSPAPSETRPLAPFEPREATTSERIAIEALLTAKPELRMLQRLAEEHDKTIVVSIGVAGGAAPVGGFANGGIYFGPDGEIGLTGSVGVGGLLNEGNLGASLTLQVTVLDATPAELDGTFNVAGASGSIANNTAGISFVFDADFEPVGITFEYGASTSALGLEAYLQQGWGTASQPVKE